MLTYWYLDTSEQILYDYINVNKVTQTYGAADTFLFPYIYRS